MDTVRPQTAEHEALARTLAEQGVEYTVGTFVDVLGRAKSKVVPVAHLPALLAGHERYTPRGMGDLGVMTPDEDECVAMPDPSTLRVMPWDRRFAWMAADLLFGGAEPFANCTRSILKRQLDVAASEGFLFNLGVETELYVFREDSLGRADGYLEPMTRVGRSEADAGVRRRGRDGRDRLPRPDGQVHERDRIRRVQLRRGGRRRAVRVRLRVQPGARDGRQDDVLPAHGAPGRQELRARGVVHAEAVHGGVGVGRALQHEHRRPRDRARTSSATRTTSVAAGGARWRTGSWPGSCATPGRSPPWPPRR